MSSPSDILTAARSYIGNEGGAFCKKWYASYSGDSTMTASWVPWCAMFVSYIFNVCGQDVAGLPSASCGAIASAAGNAGRTIDVRSAEPGDIVIFNWHNDNVGHDHVGIVELNRGNDGLQTIEGNTSNAVNRRNRSWYYVQYVIRPIWSDQSAATPTANPTAPVDGMLNPSESILAYDNYMGPLTWRYVQMRLKRAGWYNRSIDGDAGYYTKFALQKYLRYNCGTYQRNCDGDFSYYSVCALQQHLINVGCYWDENGYGIVDGDWGNMTTTAVQRAINAEVL
jgi:hypothetical protein